MNTQRPTSHGKKPGTRNQNLILLGHRGTRIYAPENTIAAFDRALQDGCDGFEFDIRLTADAVPIVCHDPRINRLDVFSTALADLRSAQTDTCLLADVISRYAKRCFLYIELKVPGIEEQLIAVLNEHQPTDYVVASFLPEALRRVHARDPQVPLGLICDDKRSLQQWPQLPIVYVMPKQRLITPELVDKLHSESKKVFVWTVNDARDMQAMADMGVDGIVSDDTALLCRSFGRGPIAHNAS